MNRFSLSLYIKGIAMGIADVIPGISGGTVALILGVYQRLLNAISAVDQKALSYLLSGHFKRFAEKIDFFFLVNLGLGIFTALIIGSHLIHYLLLKHASLTWGTFFGLITASIYILLKKISWQDQVLKIVILLALGISFGLAVVSFIPIQTPQVFWMDQLAGFIAISAMILPGISGSFILLILGKYLVITGAVKQFYLWDNFIILINFTFGAVIGLLVFSRLLKYLLARYYTYSLSILIGFIIGSLKKIWPWREAIETIKLGNKTLVLQEKLIIPSEFNTHEWLVVFLMLLAALVVIIIDHKSHKVS
jgi:putative membrane protein